MSLSFDKSPRRAGLRLSKLLLFSASRTPPGTKQVLSENFSKESRKEEGKEWGRATPSDKLTYEEQRLLLFPVKRNAELLPRR